MRLFKIILDNRTESYFAGQVVQGRILIEVDKPKRIKALKLRCTGGAYVHWREGSGKTSSGYGGNEQYFTFNSILVGDETQDTDLVLPEGESWFPFHVQLPPGIPSSFEGAHGNVRYALRATITRPWKFSQKQSLYFTVNGFLDLNLFGHASRSFTCTRRGFVNAFSILRCSFCGHSRVGFQLGLDKTGFVPGDTVRFNIVVRNESNHRVAPITLQLFHVATYRDMRWNRLTTEQKVIEKRRGPSVPPKSTLTWDSTTYPSGVNFKIPPIPPTNLGGGSLISLQYYLGVILQVSSFFETIVEGKVQLIIGTVPYRNFFEELMPASYFAQRQISQVPPAPALESSSASDVTPTIPTAMPTQPVNVTPLDFNSPPPTYDEAMELYARYGSTLPSPSAPLGDASETVSMQWEEGSEDMSTNDMIMSDIAVPGRTFNPRYATYEWDRHQENS